jgi:hypothetical protein
MLIRIERAAGGIAEGAADAAWAELDATEKARNDEQPLELSPPQKFQKLHPRPADLAVVPSLLDQLTVFVSHPARPAVVTGLVVLLFASRELFLDLAESRRRHRRGEEASHNFGCWMLDAGCWMLDAGCWMLDAGCWMLDATKASILFRLCQGVDGQI